VDILALIRNRTLWEKIIDEIPKSVSSLASPKVKLGHHSHQQHSVVFFSFGKLRFFGSMIRKQLNVNKTHITLMNRILQYPYFTRKLGEKTLS
jgi:hypothetical protein